MTDTIFGKKKMKPLLLIFDCIISKSITSKPRGIKGEWKEEMFSHSLISYYLKYKKLISVKLKTELIYYVFEVNHSIFCA